MLTPARSMLGTPLLRCRNRRLRYDRRTLAREGEETMRWLRYQADGRDAYGIIEGDEVVEVTGDPFAGYEMTRTRRKLRDVKFLVPVVPKTFYAAGLNYADHVTEMAKKRGEEPQLPPNADIGYRANNALIAHGENTVTFKPMGPWIETDFDLDKAQTIVRVNDQVTDHFHTNNMIHGVAKFISRMSQYLTLYPGDVVWMGTEGAPRNLKHGDVCEIEITGIGTLRNPLVREGA